MESVQLETGGEKDSTRSLSPSLEYLVEIFGVVFGSFLEWFLEVWSGFGKFLFVVVSTGLALASAVGRRWIFLEDCAATYISPYQIWLSTSPTSFPLMNNCPQIVLTHSQLGTVPFCSRNTIYHLRIIPFDSASPQLWRKYMPLIPQSFGDDSIGGDVFHLRCCGPAEI
jgi:hypothetical protein